MVRLRSAVPATPAGWAAWVLSLSAFVGYAAIRHRYVGGCDTAAYLSMSYVLRGMDAHLQSSMDPAQYPALVPLCHQLVGGKIVGVFPFGYPVLLAIAGAVGVETWINPGLGALGVGLVYLATAPLAGRRIALSLAVLWAVTPIVIWASTQLMSDLPAATLGLLSYVLLSRRSVATSGAVLGFSAGIRPTNLLLLLPLALSQPRPRSLIRLAVSTAAVSLAWILLGWALIGHVLPTQYTSDNWHNLGLERFGAQLLFLVSETASALWPMVALALVGLWRRPKRCAPLLIWLAAFILLYACWRHPYDAWWRTRFVLPAYPAIFLMAAHGAAELAAWLDHRWRRACSYGALLAIGALAYHNLAFADRHGLVTTRGERAYYEDARRVAAQVPRDSLVGAINFTIPLRLYAGLESFDYRRPSAVALVEAATRAGRSAYAVIEPDMFEHEGVRALQERFRFVSVANLTCWHGLVLHRLLRELPPSEGLTLLSSSGLQGDPAGLLRPDWPADGTAWEWRTGVVLADPEATVTFTAPFVVARAVEVAADGTCELELQGSTDGRAFQTLGQFPHVSGGGLRARHLTLPRARAWPQLRIVVGDSGGQCPIDAVAVRSAAWTVSVVAAHGTDGSLDLVTNGHAPPVGAAWNGPGTVRLRDESSWIEFVVPPGSVVGLEIVRDGNDQYVLTATQDDARFAELTRIARAPAGGMQPVFVPLGDLGSTRRLRLAALTGDGSYSVAEIRPILAAP